MISKVKDLSKVKLNNDDVMIKAVVKVNQSSNIDLSAVGEANKKAIEKNKLTLVSMTVVASGKNSVFSEGDYVTLKSGVDPSYELYEEETNSEFEGNIENRIFVVGAYNIDYGISAEFLK